MIKRPNLLLFTTLVFALGCVADSASASDSVASVQTAAACMPSASADKAADGRVMTLHEEKFVAIKGIEQWVTIKGASCANPVVLFLHGGPGNTMTPYADTIYGAWEKDFTLVQWDQRGAGKTYERNAPAADATLTLEQMTADGIELATYLTRHLGKKKVILTGGSWGSILGVYMVKARPDLFQAYVGVSQMVSQRDNQMASYIGTIALARSADDKKTVTTLEGLGAPPWINPRNFGILRRATRVYEAKATTRAPDAWWRPASGYDTPQFSASYEAGEDYSFLQFVGLKDDGMFSKVDLPKLGTKFDIPVFLVQGAEDLVTVASVTKRYFDSISAPEKEYVLVPLAGHDPNQALVDAQYQILKKRMHPSAK